MLPLFTLIRNVNELNNAIKRLDYEKVERMLADPEVEVNFYYRNENLPLKTMFTKRNPRMARLFINCPRVDWKTPIWDQCMFQLEAKYGIQYERLKGMDDSELNCRSDYLHVLTDQFVTACPAEAEIIYDKLFSGIGPASFQKRLFSLLDYLINHPLATQIFIKYMPKDEEVIAYLLSTTSSLENARLLIDLCTDVNGTNVFGETPLISQASNLCFDIVELLIEKGADLQLVDSNGNSVFGVDYSGKILERYHMSEATFRALLQHQGKISNELLLAVFKKYPHYKTIFESDLLHNLRALEYISQYHAQLSDEDYLLHLKIFIKHGNASSSFSLRTLLESRSDLTKLHANELLHLACESNLTEIVKMLVTEFNANINSIIDGKPALFKTPGQSLGTLSS